jgi:hypothetical protein
MAKFVHEPFSIKKHKLYSKNIKPSWIHLCGYKKINDSSWETTICGKTAHRTERTTDINLVTCPRCLEIKTEQIDEINKK